MTALASLDEDSGKAIIREEGNVADTEEPSSTKTLDAFFDSCCVLVKGEHLPFITLDIGNYGATCSLGPVFRLLKILFDPLNFDTGESLEGQRGVQDCHRALLARRVLFSKWLMEQCCKVYRNADVSPLWRALIAGDHLTAASIVRAEGNLRLSVLLSMARDGNMERRALLAEQVSVWRRCSADARFPRSVWLVYLLLAGEVDTLVQEVNLDIEKNWIFALSLYYHYASNERSETISESFNRYWNSGVAPQNIHDSCLLLLRYRASHFQHERQEVITGLLQSNAFEAFTDSTLNWIVIILLFFFKDCTIPLEMIHDLSMNLIAQLTASKQHRLALMVAMLGNPTNRDLYVRLAESVESLDEFQVPPWLSALSKVHSCADDYKKFELLLCASAEPNVDTLVQAHAIFGMLAIDAVLKEDHAMLQAMLGDLCTTVSTFQPCLAQQLVPSWPIGAQVLFAF